MSIRLEKDIQARKKRSVIILAAVTCVLAVIAAVTYFADDRKAPVIDASGVAQKIDISDGKNPSDQILLAGITATDNRDGDLSDRVRIKSLHMNDLYSMTVTYVCRDNAGNLATESVNFSLKTDTAQVDPPETTTAEPDTDLTKTQEASKSGIIDVPTEPATETEQPPSQEPTPEVPDTPEPVTEEPTTPEPTTPEPTTPEPTTPEPTTPEPTTPEPTTPEPTTPEPTTPEPTTPEPTTPEPTSPEPATAEPSPAGYPSIVLIASEVHVRVGETFHWKNMIADMTDDKDGLSFLYQNIWIEGFDNIDTSRHGSFSLIYHVKDSDGHMSPGVPLTVYVD